VPYPNPNDHYSSHAKEAWGLCAGTQGPASNAVFASDGSIHDGLGIKLRQHMAV